MTAILILASASAVAVLVIIGIAQLFHRPRAMRRVLKQLAQAQGPTWGRLLDTKWQSRYVLLSYMEDCGLVAGGSDRLGHRYYRITEHGRQYIDQEIRR